MRIHWGLAISNLPMGFPRLAILGIEHIYGNVPRPMVLPWNINALCLRRNGNLESWLELGFTYTQVRSLRIKDWTPLSSLAILFPSLRFLRIDYGDAIVSNSPHCFIIVDSILSIEGRAPRSQRVFVSLYICKRLHSPWSTHGINSTARVPWTNRS